MTKAGLALGGAVAATLVGILGVAMRRCVRTRCGRGPASSLPANQPTEDNPASPQESLPGLTIEPHHDLLSLYLPDPTPPTPALPPTPPQLAITASPTTPALMPSTEPAQQGVIPLPPPLPPSIPMKESGLDVPVGLLYELQGELN